MEIHGVNISRVARQLREDYDANDWILLNSVEQRNIVRGLVEIIAPPEVFKDLYKRSQIISAIIAEMPKEPIN